MNEVIERIITEMQSKKKDYEQCFSNKEAKLITQWNKAINECIDIVKRHV